MYRASVVGIDNTGKTSVVDMVDDIDGVVRMYLTKPRRNNRFSRAIERVAVMGEAHGFRSLTGAAYLLHLGPYFVQQRRSEGSILLSDRDPLLDTVCYAHSYLPSSVASIAVPSLRGTLERTFRRPDSLFHLTVSPETSMRRCGASKQLHENLRALQSLSQMLEREVGDLELRGTKVVRYDTERYSIPEIACMVRSELTKVMKARVS